MRFPLLDLRRPKDPRCPSCGYDITDAQQARCPECGTVLLRSDSLRKGAGRTWRNPFTWTALAFVGWLFGVTGYAFGRTRSVRIPPPTDAYLVVAFGSMILLIWSYLAWRDPELPWRRPPGLYVVLTSMALFVGVSALKLLRVWPF